MGAVIRNVLGDKQWSAITRLHRNKVLVLVLVIVVPGGLVVPACMAVYQAIRHAVSR